VAYMGMTWKAGAPHDRLLPSGRADAVGPHVSPPQRSKLMLFRKTAGKSQRGRSMQPCAREKEGAPRELAAMPLDRWREVLFD
jgi:hypothetical protein